MNNKFEITYSDENSYKGIIDFFRSKNLVVSYFYGDIFNFLKSSYEAELEKFYQNDITNPIFKPFFMLTDMLANNPIKTVFCIKENKKGFRITKGNKKIVAMAANKLNMCYIIVVSHQNYGTLIETDDQLFDILYQLDPTIKTVRCDIADPTDPNLHVLENINTAKKWRSL